MAREKAKRAVEPEEKEGEKEERERERGGRKRRHSHQGGGGGKGRSKREEEESDSESSEDESSSELSESDSSDSESSSTSEEERERRRKRRRQKKKKEKMKKKRRSSEGSRSKSKKKHGVHKTAKKKKLQKIDQISIEDYFRKSVEFRTWLSEERKIFFSDLKSDESRSLFAEFVREWNGHQLHKKYYKGIQSASLEHGKQTGHVWKFSRSVSQGELSGLKESVSSWTASGEDVGGKEADQTGGKALSLGPHPLGGPSTSGVVKGPIIGPMIGPIPQGSSAAMATDSDPHVAEERRREEREREKRGRKEMRKQHELAMDELLPKATGKEARFEKKKIRAEKRREREISPDVADSSLMGPSTNIRQKIQNRKFQRQNRAQAAAEKVAEIQAREKSRMSALLEIARASKKEGALW